MRTMVLCLIIATLMLVRTDAITSGSTNMYIHVPGKILPGPFTKGSIKVVKNLTLNECAAECSLEYLLNQFPCYAYEYAQRDNTCLMTNVTTLVAKGGYLGLRSNSAMDYYERPKGTYANLFQPYPHKVLQQDTTYFAVFKNKTLEKCALFCLMESRKPCMSFSYSENKQTCGLSSVYYTAGNGQTLRPSSEYNHYQYYTTWPCNATIPWHYSPRAIASPYFPYASLKDVDCYLVIEAPEGKQIDLQFSTFYSKSDMCDTYGGVSVYDGQTSGGPFMSRICSSDTFVDRRYQSSTGYLYLQFATGSVPMAFKAVYDFIEIDLCQMAPCKNNGTCQWESGRYQCACAEGFTGKDCETDIDECASNPCYLGGRCIDKVNGFECNCPKLLGGPRCNVFVGLCYLEPCQNGGKCSPRGTNKYMCTCPEEYSGANCTDKLKDPCDDNPCQNGAQCESNIAKQAYTCTCVPGFTGSACETNIDDCASTPCMHNFKCLDLVNDYRCECPPILGGRNCELFLGGCATKPCVHGHCHPAGATNYTCECDDGYGGKTCNESFIDFCDPDPCKHGTCTSFKLGPSCDCDRGYEGFFCDTKTNYCDGVNCNQGECTRLEDDFRCNCLTGFEGRYCNQTTNHCKTANCNGGFCINTLTSHFCVCKGGHTGETCESPDMEKCKGKCVNGSCVTSGNTTQCVCSHDVTGDNCDVQIDHCIMSPCAHGQCDSISGGHTCTCDVNYTGKNCDTVIDYCVDNHCVFGFCQSDNEGYNCLCGQGYHGRYCDLKEGETPSSSTITTTTTSSHCSGETCRFGVCDSDFTNVCVCILGYSGEKCDLFIGCDKHNPCLNGNCSEIDRGYECTCDDGFDGERCEYHVTDADPCASVTCQNGGVCYSFNQSNSSNGYQCICVPGYHGRACEYTDACRNTLCKDSKCVPIGNGFRCEMPALSSSSNVTASISKFITGCRKLWIRGFGI